MLNRFILGFAALGLAAFCAPAAAQTYPDQSIRLLVSFAPGGGTDLTARIAAEDLSRRFGKPVIVENRPGAQTAVALELTSKAKNDGYTFLWTTSDGMAILRALRDNVSFNFDRDFEFVATTMKYSLVLAVNPKLPIKSVADLVAYGKANPGKLTYATSGISGELAAALILKAMGVQAVQVPYGGSAPAAAAAVNGTTDMVIAAPASTKDHIASGTLRAIVITDVARNKQFPDVPTLMDAGIPDLKNVSILLYNGVLAPAGTPAPILERWRAELQGMLKDPAVIERLGRINYEVSYLGGPEFKASMINDSDRWKEVARANGIKLSEKAANNPAGRRVASPPIKPQGNDKETLMLTRLTSIAVAALGLAAASAAPSLAQTYPEQTVRLIVPFAPGGGTDLTARIVAEDLTKRFGKPVVVENKPGAQTAVALELTARAKPDGYTLMWATSDGMAFLPALKDDLSFNLDKDFEYVATTMRFSLVLSINPKLPIKSMSELVTYGKANPGKLTYAGAGTAAELGTALIMKAIGVQAVYVPYGGSAPAVAATVSGTTDMVLNAPASGKDQILSGNLRALAITDTVANASFPGVPTLMQTGLPELKNESILLFNGVLAPAGTPAAVLERWRTALQASLKDPGVIERLAKIEYVPDFRPGAQFKDFMAAETRRWREVARVNNIKLAN